MQARQEGMQVTERQLSTLDPQVVASPIAGMRVGVDLSVTCRVSPSNPAIQL